MSHQKTNVTQQKNTKFNNVNTIICSWHFSCFTFNQGYNLQRKNWNHKSLGVRRPPRTPLVTQTTQIVSAQCWLWRRSRIQTTTVKCRRHRCLNALAKLYKWHECLSLLSQYCSTAVALLEQRSPNNFHAIVARSVGLRPNVRLSRQTALWCQLSRRCRLSRSTTVESAVPPRPSLPCYNFRVI